MDKKEMNFIIDKLSQLKCDDTNGMDEYNFTLNNQVVKFVRKEVGYTILINYISLFERVYNFEIKRVLSDLEEITKWIEIFKEKVKQL